MPSLDPLTIPAAVGLVAAVVLGLRAGHRHSHRTPAWLFPAVLLATGGTTVVLTVLAATEADAAMAPVLLLTAGLLAHAASRRLRVVTGPPQSPRA